MRDYNIRPRQCQTPRFSCETTISGPDNVRPHVFRARLQYQAPTMSDPTLFVRDYNIRPRQCQTPRLSCESTILSGHLSETLEPSLLDQRIIFRAISQLRIFMSQSTSRLKVFMAERGSCSARGLFFNRAAMGRARFLLCTGFIFFLIFFCHVGELNQLSARPNFESRNRIRRKYHKDICKDK